LFKYNSGGYSYRICKKVEGKELTEECFQQTPLDFATPETEIRYQDGSQKPFNVTSPTTNVGTFPVGSQWRKNAVPMCGCDIGISCSEPPASALAPASSSGYLCKDGKCYEGWGKETK
jgi:hypothetical protein